MTTVYVCVCGVCVSNKETIHKKTTQGITELQVCTAGGERHHTHQPNHSPREGGGGGEREEEEGGGGGRRRREEEEEEEGGGGRRRRVEEKGGGGGWRRREEEEGASVPKTSQHTGVGMLTAHQHMDLLPPLHQHLIMEQVPPNAPSHMLTF